MGTRYMMRFLRDNRGTAAVEYGLIVALIVLGMMAALNGVASQTNTMWTSVKEKSAAATGN